MIGPGEIFTVLFVTLGPLKIIGPFAQRTHGLDDATVRAIAIRAFAIATLAVIAGAFVGRTLAHNWGISLPAIELTAGIVFFVVALRQLLEQYEPPHAATSTLLQGTPMAMALRLLSPIVLTPYGVAAVITLLMNTTDGRRMALIVMLLVGIMLLNLLAMLYARKLASGATIVILQLLGVVLAVLQVALAVQIVIAALQRLGVVSGT